MLQLRSLRSRPRLLADIGRLHTLQRRCAGTAALRHADLMLPRALGPRCYQAPRQLAWRHRHRCAIVANCAPGSLNGGRGPTKPQPGRHVVRPASSPTVHTMHPLALQMQACGCIGSASAGRVLALGMQMQGECRLSAAFRMTMQVFLCASGHIGQCAFALCVLWQPRQGRRQPRRTHESATKLGDLPTGPNMVHCQWGSGARAYYMHAGC